MSGEPSVLAGVLGDALFYAEQRAKICEAFAIRYADGLIEIAAAFERNYYDDESICLGCGCYTSDGCFNGCPGLLARRALGIA